jgi:shikimate dehydrogenase
MGLSGATRLHVIVGDPVAQTKSPEGLTREFAARGADAICVPLQVASEHFDTAMRTLADAGNVDGVILTIPHKFAGVAHCSSLSARARVLGAVNVLSRVSGGWAGDMTDGAALVAALRARGCEPRGLRVLLVGAGGAGSAVALALVEAGVSELAVCEPDAGRRDRLLAAFAGRSVRAASADPSGFGLVVNATPLGMTPGDAMPVDAARLDPGCVVADFITAPEVTPLLAAAGKRGCVTVTGMDVFKGGVGLLADILLEPHAQA